MHPKLQVLETWAHSYCKLDQHQPHRKSEGHGAEEIFDKKVTHGMLYVGGLRPFGVDLLVRHFFCLLSGFPNGDPKLLFSIISIVPGRMDASKRLYIYRDLYHFSTIIFVWCQLNVNVISEESPDMSFWHCQAAILSTINLGP